MDCFYLCNSKKYMPFGVRVDNYSLGYIFCTIALITSPYLYSIYRHPLFEKVRRYLLIFRVFCCFSKLIEESFSQLNIFLWQCVDQFKCFIKNMNFLLWLLPAEIAFLMLSLNSITSNLQWNMFVCALYGKCC